jgi:hypothetical protein
LLSYKNKGLIYSSIVIALFGHCISHALHPMHALGFTATAFPFFTLYTP